MPKKGKGSATVVFPSTLERYQLWRLATDEVLAAGSTVASVSNRLAVKAHQGFNTNVSRNSPSLSHGENRHKQEPSAGPCQIIGTQNIES